jgi:hypothetical protein
MHQGARRSEIHAGTEIVAAQSDNRNLEVGCADVAIFHGDDPAGGE